MRYFGLCGEKAKQVVTLDTFWNWMLPFVIEFIGSEGFFLWCLCSQGTSLLSTQHTLHVFLEMPWAPQVEKCSTMCRKMAYTIAAFSLLFNRMRWVRAFFCFLVPLQQSYWCSQAKWKKTKNNNIFLVVSVHFFRIKENHNLWHQICCISWLNCNDFFSPLQLEWHSKVVDSCWLCGCLAIV